MKVKVKKRYRATDGRLIPVCACGCGEPIPAENTFVLSHHNFHPEYRRVMKQRRVETESRRWETRGRCEAVVSSGPNKGKRCRHACTAAGKPFCRRHIPEPAPHWGNQRAWDEWYNRWYWPQQA